MIETNDPLPGDPDADDDESAPPHFNEPTSVLEDEDDDE